MSRSRSIPFCSAKDAGLALAAVLAGDRELTHVAGHLPPDCSARIRALTTSPHVDKPVLIAQLLAHLQPPLGELSPTLPVRLCALLAAQLPRAQGRQLLASAPLTRAGFEPERELVARLVRIARFSSAEAARKQQRERTEVPS